MTKGDGTGVNDALNLPLNDQLEKDMNRLLEQEEDFVLAMIDVDQFDPVNKLFGHDEGDKVLIRTGEHLRDSMPEGATLYRFGGDEFAMLFHNGMEKEEVLLAMEELRKSYAVTTPDGKPQTISIGISTSMDDGANVLELVRKAEDAMFRGKLMGRNRVCLAREEKMITKTTHYTEHQLKRLTKIAKRDGVGEAILLREALDLLLKKYDA